MSNFFSIKDEVVLDIRAGNIKTKKAKSLSKNIAKYKSIDVLKTIAIYGANASGKSNLIKAIRFCNMMVFQSHNFNENTIFNFAPFKFDSYPKKPSAYFIRFVINEIEYEYTYSLTRKAILTESLYYYPNGRKTKVFVRNEQAGKTKKEKYSFGTSVIKRPMDVAESTSNKTLYISRASQMDREISKTIFNFFHQTFILNYHSYGVKHMDTIIKENKKQLLQALQMADSDIVDFKQNLKKENAKSITVNFLTEETTFEESEEENERIEIKTYHKYAPEVGFDFISEESLGTKKLFFMMLTIFDIVRNNKILLIDEIEDSLHPHLIEYIIQIFNTSDHAQLIFSTHNTNLLNLNKLRKDQVWFVNKTESGSSDLYSLYDFSDFRDTMDLEKAYLQGRFDAIPIINDSKEKILSMING